jgi:hypothetical protein
MKALIETELLGQIQRDRQRITDRRARRTARSDALVTRGASAKDALVIRTASAHDNGPLQRLAMLDSAPTPRGAMLVAERDGLLVAAVPLGKGPAIADPFVPSADVVGLLELRRAQLRPAG